MHFVTTSNPSTVHVLTTPIPVRVTSSSNKDCVEIVRFKGAVREWVITWLNQHLKQPKEWDITRWPMRIILFVVSCIDIVWTVIVKCGFNRISWHVSFYHCVKIISNTHTFVRKFMLVLLKCIEISLQLIYNKMSLGLRRFFKDGRRSPDWCIPGNIVCVAGHLIIFKTTHLSFFIDYDQHTITRLSFTQDLVS